MKNLLFIFMALTAILFSSCNGKDPIWQTKPQDSSYATGFPLDQFHKMGIANDTTEQKALVDQYRKILTKNVITHYPCIKDEKNIHFVFGSGSVKGIMSGDGKTYNGNFNNELIIILNDDCVKDTLVLASGNGMLNPIHWKTQSNWGTAETCRFTIAPGEGLAHHLPQLEAWAAAAGELSVPIRDKKGNIVVHEKYLHYLGKYESVLFPGDVIDMCAGKIFNKLGQEVEFETRLKESEKVNAIAHHHKKHKH